jgi:hypothetical protein
VPVIRAQRRAIGAALFALALAVAPAFATSATATPAASPAASPAATEASTVAGTPVSLALLVPLTVRPTGNGLIDSATLAGYTAPTGILSRELDALIGTPAVIGIDPMIIASIRVLGNSAPVSAIAWLARLSSASNETFALAYADADPATLARVDALPSIAPLGFDFAIDSGHFGPAVTATPTATPGSASGSAATPIPAPTPTSTAPAQTTTPSLPTTPDEVLQWTYALPTIAWPADDTVISGDLSDLASAGYANVVLSSTNLSATDSGLVSLTGIQGVVSDVGVSSLVRDAIFAAGNAQQDDLTRLNSALTGMEAVSPGRTVVATLDRKWSLGALNIPDLYADLATQSSVLPVGLSAVLNGAKPAAQVTDEPGDAARIAQIKTVLADIATEDSFATVADNPLLVREPRRLELLSLLAVWWVQGSDAWNTQVQSFTAGSATLLSSVQIVSGSNLFVGAGSTNIPVTVSNALPVPVTVYVTVTSPSSVLQVQKQSVALKIEPGSSNKAAIPVQALTNGNVTTTVTLTSVAAVPIGSPDYVKADLQPGWEGVGTTIVVLLLVLVFGGGIARNIVKRRRARAASTDGATGD